MDVAEKFKKDEKEFDIIIACDTVIHFNDQIIGKPTDSEDAFRILKQLNNREHSVYTGVTLVDSSLRSTQFHEKTHVVFGNISDEVLHAYVETGEPIGRAGAYGIQLKGSALVQEVRGCYNNVVGIPIFELVKQLRLFLKK
uniref:Maf-like protein n=1 Tax=Acrobeloides nanus TaxID=290746 RepID=A0A914D4C9_9BILA